MEDGLYVSCIIAAGGTGTRMGGDVSKQFMKLSGKPILTHTLERFQKFEGIDEIILVTTAGTEWYCEEIISENNLTKVTKIVCGGQDRQQSVYNGLKAVSPRADIIMVHDGVRPFVRQEEINLLIKEAVENGACCLGVKTKDTIKICDGNNTVVSTPQRDMLWAVHTPQVFIRDIIYAAYDMAEKDGYIASDDASLAERLGYSVSIVEGSYYNIKITTPEDLLTASSFLKFYK